mmetsp:Transcript_8097/g.18499  ORF Transcript_8097/g.18499 Transcript_8097/m.18499 type:complete len:203 (-) Transcript_8097:1203-1811(-)
MLGLLDVPVALALFHPFVDERPDVPPLVSVVHLVHRLAHLLEGQLGPGRIVEALVGVDEQTQRSVAGRDDGVVVDLVRDTENIKGIQILPLVVHLKKSIDLLCRCAEILELLFDSLRGILFGIYLLGFLFRHLFHLRKEVIEQIVFLGLRTLGSVSLLLFTFLGLLPIDPFLQFAGLAFLLLSLFLLPGPASLQTLLGSRIG